MVYKALLTQIGTNAPVATVIENTLGVDITYEYVDIGVYYIHTTDFFPAENTLLYIDNSKNTINNEQVSIWNIGSDGSSYLILETTDCDNTPINDVINEMTIEIKINP